MARQPGDTRLERILGVPLADDALRQWPQSGEVIESRTRIGEVESHWGEPFEPPAWRAALAAKLDMPAHGTWPAAEALQGDDDAR